MLAADTGPLQAQLVAQHATAQERPLQVQFIDAAHEPQILVARPHGIVIQRGARQLQELRLAGEAQSMIWVDHRLALDPGDRPSAPAKKSFSSASWPIFACRVLISGPESALCPELPKISAARSSNWFFH
jgi:hypothetical protein